MKHSDPEKPDHTAQNFPVVGIGASAGGLDAFKKLIREIPEHSGMAYVIVQHLSPDHDSNLTEILGQVTKIPVHEIINDINLAPNNIYVIPENSILTTEDGVLKLASRERYSKRNMAIDVFFESLAEVHKTFAIGVVLSGTAFDGTMGLKRIKEVGGATIAQDPDSAAYKSMPQSAIDADAVDYVLAPEKIPAQLLQIYNTYESNYAYAEEEENIPKDEEEILRQIIKIVYQKTGNDFIQYKQPTIRRRIARRMVITKKDSINDYLNLLRNDKAEQDQLFNDFLIPVSYFFRDPKIFESLKEVIFPQIVQNATNKTLRIWVAGCSTGEEAYSIAISIHEFLSDNGKEDIKVQLFASDVSEKSITKARAATYSPQDVQPVSEQRLNNYFTKRQGNYQINKVIRDMCVFAVHNFVKDPPFARMDLVSCRNVLIYLNPTLQNKVLTTFHYALKEKGILFLGKSESASNVSNLFDPIAKHEKLYTRKFAPGRYVPEAFKPAHVLQDRAHDEAKGVQDTDFRKVASEILFSKYTPAGVIINDHQEIIHFHGDTSPFLLPSPGKPNFNILKMAREGIGFELRNALLIAKEENETVVKENVIVKNQPYLATMEIIPLRNGDDNMLVIFRKCALPVIDKSDKSDRKSSDQLRIKELENELAQMREDIKRVTEEQQTAFEELQTTNEELLSSSEELQALNEELETATEEMQSNNEELMCVNDELMDRQEQLISLRNYSESIVNTIREPLIILDKDLRIKSVNPSFYKYFRTTEQETEGRSLFEIGQAHWDIPKFKEMLMSVIPDKTTIEDYRIEVFFPGLGKRVMVINARRIVDATPSEYILMAVEDITLMVEANELLTAKNTELEFFNSQLDSFSTAASHDLQEPLRKIHMFSKMMLEDESGLTDTGKHHLNRIIVSIDNMRQLIEDLINYTRINIPEKLYKKSDVNQLLKKTLVDLKDILNEKNAIVNLEPIPQVKVMASQFQQLFTNLIVNSIKYSKEDVAPVITIASETPTDEEVAAVGGRSDVNYIKITVSDNGLGFSNENAEKIFNPFFRLHSKDKYRGTGLGLTLCKKIASNHNGFIKAESKINVGTVMIIYLPL